MQSKLTALRGILKSYFRATVANDTPQNRLALDLIRKRIREVQSQQHAANVAAVAATAAKPAQPKTKAAKLATRQQRRAIAKQQRQRMKSVLQGLRQCLAKWQNRCAWAIAIIEMRICEVQWSIRQGISQFMPETSQR